MTLLNNRILLSCFIMASACPAMLAQRCKVSYYSSSQSVVVEAYISDAVDVQPEFPGGDNAMMRFINRERRYPRQAYDSRIEGRVLCGFIVHPNGSISDIEVVRGVEESIDREAVRIIRSMPSWKAGTISGAPVPVYLIMPIPFRL